MKANQLQAMQRTLTKGSIVLIFGWRGFPRLGIQGAALATVISRFTVMVVALIFLYRKHSFPKHLKKHLNFSLFTSIRITA